MKVSGPLLKRNHRFAIFWGGGLGDILTLRPLLMGLEEALDTKVHFFTTATHLQDVFPSFGLDTVEVRILPSRPFAALRAVHASGIRFDWLYLGPYPRIKTRMLAHAVWPKRIWSLRHADVHPFLGEQVLADIRAFGLDGPAAIRLPYGGPWHRPGSKQDAPAHSYLVLHPGAKDRWETTRWPDEHWAALIRRLLLETLLDLVLVGVRSETPQLEELVGQFDAATGSRLTVRTDLSLAGLASLLEAGVGTICHNSGILHLSAMLGKPTVAVTGSSANFWRPPYPHVINVTSGACDLACNQYRCPVPFYDARCIRELSVEAVMRTVRERLLRSG